MNFLEFSTEFAPIIISSFLAFGVGAFVFLKGRSASLGASRTISAILVFTIIGFWAVAKIVNPVMPEAIPSCELESEFAPTNIICNSASQNHSGVYWLANGVEIPLNETRLTIPVNSAGNYNIELVATKKNFFSTLTDKKSLDFLISNPPPPEVIEKRRTERVSERSLSSRSVIKEYSASDNCEIVDALVTSKRLKNASVEPLVVGIKTVKFSGRMRPKRHSSPFKPVELSELTVTIQIIEKCNTA